MAESKRTEAPPAYTTSQYPPGAYPPPQPSGYPPPQGYAPPPQGYAPPPQAYAPPPQAYAPPPQPQMTSQSTTNVVVVGGQQPTQTIIVQKTGVNHCMHCCISIFFPPWIIVWIILCICN